MTLLLLINFQLMDAITVLSYLISANTLYLMYLAGDNSKYTWKVGIVNQFMWCLFIYITKSYGLVPMVVGLLTLYSFNEYKRIQKL